MNGLTQTCSNGWVHSYELLQALKVCQLWEEKLCNPFAALSQHEHSNSCISLQNFMHGSSASCLHAIMASTMDLVLRRSTQTLREFTFFPLGILA